MPRNKFRLAGMLSEVIAHLKVGQIILCGVKDDMASWVEIHYTPLPGLKQA